ncbi:hypothetical protein ACFLT4_02655 [Chloroflexota bacterium]
MSTSQKTKLSAIVFFIAYAFLLEFANEFSKGIEWNFAFFWIAIFGIFTTAAYQVYHLETSNQRAKLLILSEIISIVLFFGLFRIMLTNQLLPGSDDTYVVLASTNYIQDHNDFLTTGPLQNRWPIIQIFGLVISQFGLKLFDIALLFPVFTKILVILLLYLIASKYYDIKTGLLASLTFASYYPIWNINSRFRPEILAYIFFFLLIYMCVMRIRNFSPVATAFLSILLLLLITMTHYTTNVMMVMFLVSMSVVFIYAKFRKLPYQPAIQSHITLIMLAIVVMLSYWMYIGEPIFYRLGSSLVELLKPTTSLTTLEYIRPEPVQLLWLKQKIILYTHDFYFLFFGGLMAYEIFKQRKCPNWQSDLILTCWAGTVLLLFLLLTEFPGTLYPARLFIFIYPFVLIIASHAILKIKSKFNRERLSIILYVLLIGFALLNVFQITFVPLNPLASVTYRVASGDGAQEIRAINWIGTSGRNIVAGTRIIHIIGYMKGEETRVSQNINLFNGDMNELRSYSWLYLNPNSPSFLSWSGLIHIGQWLDNETLVKISNTAWLQKVYTNGEWEVYRISP